jgi:uncharacterized membrane protein (DUF106 family)
MYSKRFFLTPIFLKAKQAKISPRKSQLFVLTIPVMIMTMETLWFRVGTSNNVHNVALFNIFLKMYHY